MLKTKPALIKSDLCLALARQAKCLVLCPEISLSLKNEKIVSAINYKKVQVIRGTETGCA